MSLLIGHFRTEMNSQTSAQYLNPGHIVSPNTKYLNQAQLVLTQILFQMDEMDELFSLREARTPVRLRFGRRSDERAVPHIFPQEV